MLSDQGSHASASATQSLQTTGNYCCVFKAAPLDRELTGPRCVANKFNDAEIRTSSSRAMRRLSRGLASTQCRVGGSTISRWTP